MDINRFIEVFAYFAPLEYHEEFRQYVSIINKKQANEFDITMITDYRRKLQKIIAEDAAKMQAKQKGN